MISLKSGESKAIHLELFDAGENPVPAPGQLQWSVPSFLQLVDDPGGDPAKKTLVSLGAVGTGKVQVYVSTSGTSGFGVEEDVAVTAGPATHGRIVEG